MNMEEGQEVEVSNKKGFEGTWLLGTIRRSKSSSSSSKKKKKLLVEYKTLVDEKGSKPLQEYIDLSHLRPLPPQQKDRPFQLNEEVDAIFRHGWRKGVINKVLEDSKYSVCFKTSEKEKDFPFEEEREFQHSELRAHLEWTDGRWLGSLGQEQCKHNKSRGCQCQEMSTPGKELCERHLADQTSCEKRRKRPREQCKSTGPQRCSEMVSPGKQYCEKHQLEGDIHNQKRRKSPREHKVLVDNGSNEKRNSSHHDLLPSDHQVHSCTETGISEPNEASVWIPNPKSSSACNIDIVTQPSLSEANDNFGETILFLMDKEITANEKLLWTKDEAASNDLRIVEINHTQLLSATAEDHQPISLLLEKSNPPILKDNRDSIPMSNDAITLRDTSTKSPKRLQSSNEVMSSFSLEARGDDRALQSSVDVTVDKYSSPTQQDERPPLENQSLPFVKTSDLWEGFESMEVFQLMPQYPHFRPLEKENEELREGLAIGNMVNFANLMKRTCKAQLDDPRSMLQMKLKALPAFEEHGFTVQPIRSRLEKLLKLKDCYSQCGERLKTFEEMVNDERREFDEIQESITRLNMELQLKGSKIAELQMKADAIGKMVESTRIDFNGEVTTPW
ncbi:hypothetical protein FRX31_019987 [Thalictrum thalictroides]|uniref:Agenet domain-containing protein n=1 Tax=Thalictrum thalictroides TaxID=46969 RepID=A0A7J6VZ85_THATH|nr:hypothetical protein FRX31_019987 [Thalictrum thalictroides]